MGTEARGELNRRPEEIHMVLDGLSRRGADPYLDRNSPFLMPILRQCVMDSSGATGRRHRRQETGHDAVSGVLYLAATKGPQGIPDNLVMDLQKGHGRLVAMELRELCRPHDIRKHDRSGVRDRGGSPRRREGVRRPHR